MISEDVGLSLDKVEPAMLGSAKKVTISKDDTIILDGAGEKSAIQERGDQIREAMENSTSDYDRYSKLSVGGTPHHATSACRPQFAPHARFLFHMVRESWHKRYRWVRQYSSLVPVMLGTRRRCHATCEIPSTCTL